MLEERHAWIFHFVQREVISRSVALLCDILVFVFFQDSNVKLIKELQLEIRSLKETLKVCFNLNINTFYNSILHICGVWVRLYIWFIVYYYQWNRRHRSPCQNWLFITRAKQILCWRTFSLKVESLIHLSFYNNQVVVAFFFMYEKSTVLVKNRSYIFGVSKTKL